MSQASLAEMVSLRDRVAIVTGAGRGIGAQIARRLAEGGASLLLVDLRAEDAAAVAQEIQDAGGRAEAFAADVTQVAEADRAVARARDLFGRMDILVNNAGVFPTSTVLDLTEDIWDLTCDVNLKALMFWSRAAARQMVADKTPGRIINITSVNATLPNAFLPHYAATKGGVSSATRALAQELGKYGIRVNSVAPGGVDTPGGRDAMTNMGLKLDPAQPMVGRSVLGRGGEPDDIACGVFFLACGLSDYVTGSNLPVDGGFLLV
jgi:2-dehydro-3-deoxy-D-gluconate 5-dehydrogenase